MQFCPFVVLLVGVSLCVRAKAEGPSPTGAEFALRDQWVGEHIARPAEKPPFSFVYDGERSGDLLGAWKSSQSVRKLDSSRTQTTQTYADPKTGLEVKCVTVTYSDFPTVEWTLFFKNTGKADTPILSEILAMDTKLVRGANGEFVLYRIKGDSCTADSYQPLEETLGPGSSKKIAPVGGRPTNGEFPYFNVARPGGGTIIVVSWAGQWAAQFTRDAGRGLRVTSGQELTHFRLHPGEEARSPMVVMQFYQGDVTRAQNTWRRWMLAHNTPRPGGKPIRPFLTTTICGMFPGLMSSMKDAEQFGERYFAEGFKPDYWNTDAGWYPCDPKIGWPQVGTWETDPERYPKGLRELSDYLHEHGVKSMVWFEPERVYSGTWLAANRPEWVRPGKRAGLLKLDDPECRKWITDRIDSLLTSEAIDLYRQDFNMDPLPYWRDGEPDDRQGITENHHVTGYFAFWDELARRHPGLVIDTCASGGRRNDLETLRRAVPVLRSDYQFEPAGNQAQTYGLSMWLPWYGSGNYQDTLYVHHSCLSPIYGLAADIRKPDVDYGMIRKVMAEWREVAELFLGDFYPLTPWTLDKKEWIGFQFDKPEAGRGFVQVFRRPENSRDSILVKLHGLDPGSTYHLQDLSSDWKADYTGHKLMEDGLRLTIHECPGDALIVYGKRSR
jgi:alpha-galactosidase